MPWVDEGRHASVDAPMDLVSGCCGRVLVLGMYSVKLAMGV